MDGALEKLKLVLKKNGAVLLVLFLGLVLMLWPQKREKVEPTAPALARTETLGQQLEKLLSQVAGAGETRVLLTEDVGERTVYQSDESRSTQADRQEEKTDTVLVTDGTRQQSGLIRQREAPTYRGAIVVCQGGADPQVKLQIVEAVSGATGLSSNRIVVLKMK